MVRLQVARNILGQTLASAVYPYFGHPPSRRRVLRGLPVPVYSCWNGMVAINATTLGGRTFRSWVAGEARSPGGQSAGEQFGREEGQCATSECHLLCKDLWTAAGGRAKVFMHTGVKLFYDRCTRLAHFWAIPIWELWQRTRARVADWLGGGASDWRLGSFPDGPPRHVQCGRGTDPCGDSGRVSGEGPCKYA